MAGWQEIRAAPPAMISAFFSKVLLHEQLLPLLPRHAFLLRDAMKHQAELARDHRFDSSVTMVKKMQIGWLLRWVVAEQRPGGVFACNHQHFRGCEPDVMPGDASPGTKMRQRRLVVENDPREQRGTVDILRRKAARARDHVEQPAR